MSTPQRRLLTWYRRVRRDLPWRRTNDPYAIWLSETMLQQTRVETVIPYYERFLAAFPTVTALAAADPHEVLRLWAGLGYYSRARNLQAAARVIAYDLNGKLPRTAAALAKLPGVGRYTAGAVASIAFGEPAAAVDGNVRRVLARFFGFEGAINSPASQPKLWELAERFLDHKSPGDFNQALMELGATVCRPRQPLCADCPLRPDCAAFAQNRQGELPRRTERRAPQHARAAAFAIRRAGRLLLLRRPERGLLAGLWELPSVPQMGQPPTNPGPATLNPLLLERTGLTATRFVSLGTVRHVFTHRDLTIEVFAAQQVRGRLRMAGDGEAAWVNPHGIQKLALSTLDRKILQLVLKSQSQFAMLGKGSPSRRLN